MLLNSGVSKLN